MLSLVFYSGEQATLNGLGSVATVQGPPTHLKPAQNPKPLGLRVPLFWVVKGNQKEDRLAMLGEGGGNPVRGHIVNGCVRMASLLLKVPLC